MNTPTRGWRTSEFWVAILSTPAVLSLLATVFDHDFSGNVEAMAVVVSAVLSAVYAIGRTHLKRPTSAAAVGYDLNALLPILSALLAATPPTADTVQDVAEEDPGEG